jgi:hypothetical protein
VAIRPFARIHSFRILSASHDQTLGCTHEPRNSIFPSFFSFRISRNISYSGLDHYTAFFLPHKGVLEHSGLIDVVVGKSRRPHTKRLVPRLVRPTLLNLLFALHLATNIPRNHKLRLITSMKAMEPPCYYEWWTRSNSVRTDPTRSQRE